MLSCLPSSLLYSEVKLTTPANHILSRNAVVLAFPWPRYNVLSRTSSRWISLHPIKLSHTNPIYNRQTQIAPCVRNARSHRPRTVLLFADIFHLHISIQVLSIHSFLRYDSVQPTKKFLLLFLWRFQIDENTSISSISSISPIDEFCSFSLLLLILLIPIIAIIIISNNIMTFFIFNFIFYHPFTKTKGEKRVLFPLFQLYYSI